MTATEKAIALGIKAAAAHSPTSTEDAAHIIKCCLERGVASPTSDAEFVRVYGGKYLTNTLWTYGPTPTSRLFKDLVEAREADRLGRP